MGKIILPPGMDNPVDNDDEAVQSEQDQVDLKKIIDEGQGYDTVEQWYYDAIHNFSFMLSREVPEKFKKETPHKTETYSCEQGIVAFKSMHKVLSKRLKGKRVERKFDLSSKDYDTLSAWYYDALVEFTNGLHENAPKKFLNGSDEANNVVLCNAGIKAFKRGASNLRSQLNG